MDSVTYDREKFRKACERVLHIQKEIGFCENISVGKNRKTRTRSVSREGYTNIGGLSESSLHLILKYFIEDDSDFHEVGCGKYQLDVCSGSTAFEIQTGHFSSILKKLQSVLPQKKICLVFPVISEKRVIWTDPETGEISGYRKSPKKETPLSLLPHLIYLLPVLPNKNLSFCIISLACDEYKLLCGWSKDRKKGSVRYNRVPTELISVLNFTDAEKYIRQYLPSFQSGENLTSRKLTEMSELCANDARIAIKILCSLGYLIEDGKDGRFIQYVFIKYFKGTGNEQ